MVNWLFYLIYELDLPSTHPSGLEIHKTDID